MKSKAFSSEPRGFIYQASLPRTVETDLLQLTILKIHFPKIFGNHSEGIPLRCEGQPVILRNSLRSKLFASQAKSEYSGEKRSKSQAYPTGRTGHLFKPISKAFQFQRLQLPPNTSVSIPIIEKQREAK